MYNYSTYTQNHNKTFLLFFVSVYKNEKDGTKKCCIKVKFQKIYVYPIPIVKRRVSNQINKIEPCIIHKILPNKGQNTLKSASNREIKSLKNNFRVKATKGIINTPKIVIEKPLIVEEPKVVTLSKVDTKPKKSQHAKKS